MNTTQIPFRFIPEIERYHATVITVEDVNAVVYVYEHNQRFYAKAFQGRRSKPDFHYYYRSAEQRDQKVNEFLTSVKASQDAKRKRRMERQNFRHTLREGDILANSWGYDQTNVDFYQVVEVSAKSVGIMEIAQHVEYTTSMSGTAIPCPNTFVDEWPCRKTVQPGNLLKMKFGYATPWDGKPRYWSSYA